MTAILNHRKYLLLALLVVTCFGLNEYSLAQTTSETVKAGGKERSREAIIIPADSQTEDIQFQPFEKNAILTIAGRSYQLRENKVFGGSAIVFEALDLQSQKIVAVKLSPMSVFAPSQSTEGELLSDVKTRPSDFEAFSEQLKDLRSRIKESNEKSRFLFLPTATDVLYLDGQFSGRYYLFGEKVKFGAVVMPYSPESLKTKSNKRWSADVNLDLAVQAENQVRMARAVYDSIVTEMAQLAEMGFGHFDIKPANIGYDPETNKFSFVDWEASRKLTALKYNGLAFHEVTDQFVAPEIPTSRFQLVSSAYSFAITLMSVLDPGFLQNLAEIYPNIFTAEDLDRRLTMVKDSLKNHHNQVLLQDFEIVSKFVKAATLIDVDLRREALAQLNLPSGFKKQLSKERGDAWVHRVKPKDRYVPKPSFQEPPARTQKPMKAIFDRAVGFFRSSKAIQCIELLQ